MENEVKKSYNPFKMWGSWIGAGLMLLITLIMPQILLLPLGIVALSLHFGFGIEICSGEWCRDINKFILFIIFLIPIIIGFLIGWGIHSLVRKYKK